MPAGHDVVEREEPAAYAPSGGRRSSTAVLPLAALGVATGAAALGAPTVWLGASLVAISSAWGRGIRAAVESLPSSAVLLVTAGMLGPLAAGAVGLDVLDRSLFARALLVASSWGAVVVAWLLGRDNRANARRSWSEVSLAAIPALVMALLLLVMVSAGNARLSWFLSGDHLRHIGLTTRTLGAGALEYSSQAYPHGWHAVMATMWAATGSRRDGAGLQLLVTLQATATWVVLVLIPLALGLTAATLSRATGLSSRMAGASGLVAGSLVLGPHFYGDYVTRGFDTTLLVLLALIAAVHRSTVAPTSSSALVTAVAAVVVTAHSWQVLLVPACVVSGIVVWRRQSWTRDRRVLRSEVLLLAAGAVASAPGLQGAFAGFGVGAAAEAGDVPPPVLGWFIVVVVSGVGLVLMTRRGQLLPAVAAVASTFLTAVLLAGLAGVGLSAYYPSKTLWVATALGLPLVAAAGCGVWAWTDGAVPVRRAAFVVVGTMGGVAVLGSLASPLLGILRSTWGAADSERVMDVVTSEAARDATVVWSVATGVDDATSQLLLDFYSASSRTPRLQLAATSVEEQCALLRDVAEPVVLTQAPEVVVRERFACAPQLDVRSP